MTTGEAANAPTRPEISDAEFRKLAAMIGVHPSQLNQAWMLRMAETTSWVHPTLVAQLDAKGWPMATLQ